MRILFLGDIVGKLGRQTASKILPSLKEEVGPDLIFANAENLAGGRGVTVDTLDEMLSLGIDYFTSGNHIFYQDGFAEILNDESMRILRPANYPSDVPGRGFIRLETKTGETVLLVNLSGISLIKGPLSDPFRTMDAILEQEKAAGTICVVDFHAELTSEKQALGFYLDGRAAAVVGTHTHVGTVDCRILPKGTAFVSDIGLVGSLDSVLGVEKEVIIDNLKYPYPRKFRWVERGPAVFNAVSIEVVAGQAKDIQRVDKTLE